MKIITCAPYNEGCEWRAISRDFTCKHYTAMGLETHYGTSDPLNRAASRNAAVPGGKWDVVFFYDTDIVVPESQVRAACEMAHDTGEMVLAYEDLKLLPSDKTGDFISGDHSTLGAAKISGQPSGAFAVPRKLWNEVGGQDERFDTWGGEDRAFYYACAALRGKRSCKRIKGSAVHLYHPKDGIKPRLNGIPLLKEYLDAVGVKSDFSYASDVLEDDSALRRVLSGAVRGGGHKLKDIPPAPRLIGYEKRGRVLYAVEGSDLDQKMQKHPAASRVDEPFVSVTIAAYQCGDLLKRAVKSVIAQSYENFELIVVSDGDCDQLSALDGIEDKRLHAVCLDENIGRYAVDHKAVSELAKGEYWAPVDADDWVEPNWLRALINRSSGMDVVFGAQAVHGVKGARQEGVKRWNGTNEFKFHAHMSGLWRRDFVIENNLTNPAFRVGWDSVMTAVPWVVGKVGIQPKPLYHRVKRDGSLTMCDETGMLSDYRKACSDKFKDIWSQIVAMPEQTATILKDSRNAIV